MNLSVKHFLGPLLKVSCLNRLLLHSHSPPPIIQSADILEGMGTSASTVAAMEAETPRAISITMLACGGASIPEDLALGSQDRFQPDKGRA